MALVNFEEASEFSDVEKLCLQLAVTMTQLPSNIPQSLFDDLRNHFDEAQMVEITSAIAWENYRARFNHAFAIKAAGFSEGAFCPLPERVEEPGYLEGSGPGAQGTEPEVQNPMVV